MFYYLRKLRKEWGFKTKSGHLKKLNNCN